jgi:4-hydroxyphenylpyruvate 3-dimethylallyltransferase
MLRFLNPRGFTFAVTLDYDTGDIKRVGFYALKLEPGMYPKIDTRLATFFKEAPSYDEETMEAIAWSFGKGGSRYVKAERSYCGQLVPLMREWNSAMSS